jgi:hypothetical protein
MRFGPELLRHKLKICLRNVGVVIPIEQGYIVLVLFDCVPSPWVVEITTLLFELVVKVVGS